MELHGVTGKPYKHPEVRRKLPTPFTRGRIDLDGGTRAKRSWKDTPVAKVVAGDMVADFGLVEATSEFIRVPEGHPEPAVWRVRLYNVAGDYKDFPGEQRVYAFSKDIDEQQARIDS